MNNSHVLALNNTFEKATQIPKQTRAKNKCFKYLVGLKNDCVYEE